MSNPTAITLAIPCLNAEGLIRMTLHALAKQHRPPDEILVIENGEIKESGNHKELLKKRGLYYSLYNLQFPEMGFCSAHLQTNRGPYQPHAIYSRI